jgi:hypothetical protein
MVARPALGRWLMERQLSREAGEKIRGNRVDSGRGAKQPARGSREFCKAT